MLASAGEDILLGGGDLSSELYPKQVRNLEYTQCFAVCPNGFICNLGWPYGIFTITLPGQGSARFPENTDTIAI